jgi:hypothetical protein
LSVASSALADDASRRVSLFRLTAYLTSGGHVFPPDADGGFNDNDDGEFKINNCKTPILCMLRLVADPEDQPRWSVRPVDVSEHVLEYSDAWSAQDFFKIEHTGNIKFLANPGAKYANNQTEYLLSLLNKDFFIEIWVRYSPVEGNGCNSSKLTGWYKLFTGFCEGGTEAGEMGQRIIECQIHDYSKILQNQRIFNSPFYDGVRDVNAVREMLRMGGFRENQNTDPGILVKKFAQIKDQTFHFGIGPDGRLVPVSVYALPSAYAKLSSPFFKFNDADPLYDGIMKIAERGGKCFFFDSFGVAHFESYFDYSVVGVMSGIDNALLANQPPDCNGNARLTGSTRLDANSLALWWYTTDPNKFRGQIVLNSVQKQRTVGDVYNHVKILTNTPDFTPIIADDLDWSLVDDPSKEGFLGYIKTLYQQEGIFGSLEAARNVINFYKAFKNPPLVLNFESYGLPVRALDIVLFDGQPARIMKVDTKISPKENKYRNTLECEWLFPSSDAGSQECPPPNNNSTPKL